MRSRATAIFLCQVEICLAGARLLATFGGSNAPWLHLICQKQTRRKRRKEEEDDGAAAGEAAKMRSALKNPPAHFESSVWPQPPPSDVALAP